MIQDLSMQVLQLGRYIMLLPKENVNDGSDSAEAPNAYATRSSQLGNQTDLLQALAAQSGTV